MTKKELFEELILRFRQLLKENGLESEQVNIRCRALSPEEAIGNTKRKDFPILTGKDVMIEAEVRGCKGQAFTDAPSDFSGTIGDVLNSDIIDDPHARGLFIAVLNAVMCLLGKCTGTKHCRTDGPEKCAEDVREFLEREYPGVESIMLTGYQPTLLEMLANSKYNVRVLDLNPANIGQERYGVKVEDGIADMADTIESADLILCTGSTLCNGTIVDYIIPDKEVLFYGISAAGACELLGLKRICFADKYSDL